MLLVVVSWLALAPASALAEGRILVANDEWTLTLRGERAPSRPDAFAQNVAAWFTGGGSGRFLAHSDNVGMLRTHLVEHLDAEGHELVLDWEVELSPALLARFDGIFVGGMAVDNQLLIDYVRGGGNVYLFAGTGTSGRFGVAPAEAAAWNTFLGAFGLGLASEYNSLTGHMLLQETHRVLGGIPFLYQNNGQSVLDLDPLDSRNRIIASHDGEGLYAVYDPWRTALGP